MPVDTLPPSRAVNDAHRLAPEAVVAALATDAAEGLSPAEAARRQAEHGPNRLADAPRRPRWAAFLDQFRDFLIIILLVAAVVSFLVSREIKTPIVIAVVVLVNAIIGFVQEGRAERSLDALREMLVTRSRARRGGQLVELASEELVPGDIVLVEAGDRIPADGRLLTATNLEIEEAALTGESHPAAKSTAAVDADHVPLGDRTGSVFMNTTVTRGRGELVVTAIGMDTEIGRIAGLLREAPAEETPLERQLDGLGHALAALAGVIVALVMGIGLVRGEPFGDLFLTAVALAVASVPEGLPAVVAVTLALGVHQMARKGAIVKRLAAVETLGCTSVICSDKTGTLTLNQMTARELWTQLQRHEVSGEGYSTIGEITAGGSDSAVSLATALLPMALCSDAAVRTGSDGRPEMVGDPTEAALVVLAEKGGLSTDELRRAHPRLAEVPFDSAIKLMATFHELANDEGERVVRCFVKGAPDVLLARSATVIGRDGYAEPVEAHREAVIAENQRLADGGMRVLAVAQRDLDPVAYDEFVSAGGAPVDLVADLTLLALVGIVDPPRPEATEAIHLAKQAGIDVKMITGDHAATAAAIGRELGLTGRAITGADLDQMSEAELQDQIDEISVFARVAPEHKMMLVRTLQGRGNVVAMTGDGVNDAPALKSADMGVAMGITGTEVTKEAATMVLTDDNFATIIGAVRQGRAIYDNIVKFLRFQLATTIGFGITFLASSVLNIAAGKPFTAVQILWVNIIMDGPPAMALGLDPPDRDVMSRRPRPIDEPLLTRGRLASIIYAAVVMAVGTLAVIELAPGEAAKAGTPTVAGTMAFTTFVLFQFFNIMNARSEHHSAFHRSTFTNSKLWIVLGVVLVLQIAASQVGFMRRLFDTEALTIGQLGVCVAVASTVLVAEEIRKAVVRVMRRTS